MLRTEFISQTTLKFGENISKVIWHLLIHTFFINFGDIKQYTNWSRVFFQSFGTLFFEEGVTLASFSAAGNIDESIILWKLSHIKDANIDQFSLIIFYGASMS